MDTVVFKKLLKEISQFKKNIVIDAGDSITLRVGKSLLVMKKDGTFTINGKDVDIVGSKHVGVESKRIDLN